MAAKQRELKTEQFKTPVYCFLDRQRRSVQLPLQDINASRLSFLKVRRRQRILQHVLLPQRASTSFVFPSLSATQSLPVHRSSLIARRLITHNIDINEPIASISHLENSAVKQPYHSILPMKYLRSNYCLHLVCKAREARIKS